MPNKKVNKPKYLIVHHTGGTDANPLADTSNQPFETVNGYHRVRFGEDVKSSLGFFIGYHYFIGKDGLVTRGRDDEDEGVHCNQVEDGKSLNLQSIGICLAGNFDVTEPTKAQAESLRQLLRDKCQQWNIPAKSIYPHRHWAPKTCYGRRLPAWWARGLIEPSNG